MKIIFTLFLSVTAAFFLFVKPVSAAGQCAYNSTQARVQPNINEHWRESYTISQGETFRVGSFHNGIDRFAEDTDMWVTGPDGFLHKVTNESVIRPSIPGTYTLHVVTINQEGPACRATAFAYVQAKDVFVRQRTIVRDNSLFTRIRNAVVIRIPSVRDRVNHVHQQVQERVEVSESWVDEWEEYRSVLRSQMRDNRNSSSRVIVRDKVKNSDSWVDEWEEYKKTLRMQMEDDI